tara:strand:- start:196 stop:420 length:225 start_codon:yes stop_codon:yes gene_type:complete
MFKISSFSDLLFSNIFFDNIENKNTITTSVRDRKKYLLKKGFLSKKEENTLYVSLNVMVVFYKNNLTFAMTRSI